ncbi:RNA-directed DNA polymerase, eukaryota, reverse transcriptase zinc-binding domain protein [Tanacetum coccineum]
MDFKVAVWNIRGSNKQKEIQNLIRNENLHLCGVIETHLKYKKIMQAGKNIFGSWEFVSNGEDNNKGCRIMVGWNPGMLKVWLINKSKQCMFFLVETICHQTKFFCTVVYASNSCLERRKLWKELENQKSITNGNPWVVMGDFNVTLKVEEHSNGSSNPSSEMVEFQDFSSGFQFTWTKSLKNPECRTLKKLDRIMSNEVFIDKYQQAHGVFPPYLISDHSPAVLNIPKAMRRKKGAFRFSNFITDKEEFLPIVKDAWSVDIEGHMMYQVVKKMKLMKPMLKKLSWKNGNVFDRVISLKEQLMRVQAEVDTMPHDKEVKERSCKILNDYNEAMRDEYTMLLQKAKVEWLKDGDRNTVFFHKIIKGRMHKSRVMTICNEKGERFENDGVAEEFLKHFQEFLGKRDEVIEIPSDRIVFPNKLSTEEADRMCRSVNEVEVKNAMFDIDDSKAPGQVYC